MKRYDVKCPFCGEINHSVYLDETDGWMECANCFCDVKVKTSTLDYLSCFNRVPLITRGFSFSECV